MQTCFLFPLFLCDSLKFWGNSRCFSKSVLSFYTKWFLKVIWYLVSLTFLNNFLCIQTWILTKASWNKNQKQFLLYEWCLLWTKSMRSVESFVIHITSVSVNWVSFSVRQFTQTSVSLRSRSMRCMLFSMAVRFVIWVAQLAGNQPLSPSLIRSPWHQPVARQGLTHWPNSSIFTCIRLVNA